MNINSPFRSKIFLRWVTSYLILLLVQVIISTGIYLYTSSVIKEEILHSNSLFLNHVKRAGDAVFSLVDNAFAELVIESNLTKFNTLDFDDQSMVQYEINRLQYKLNSIMGRSEDIGYIMIYLKELGIVLTQDSLMTAEEYFNVYYKDEGMTFVDWDWYTRKKHHRYYGPNTYRNSPDSGIDEANVIFMHSFPQNTGGDSGVTIVIGIQNVLPPDIINDLSDNYIFLIVNDENEMVSKSHPDFNVNSLVIPMGRERERHFEIDDKGNTYIVSALSSDVNNLYYVAAVLEKLFWEKLIFIRNLTIISLGVLLLVGAFFAYTFTIKNYNPIRGLVDHFEREDYKYSSTGTYDEYFFIGKMISEIENENRQVTDQIRDLTRESWNDILLKLLKGRLDEKCLTETGVEGIDTLLKEEGYVLVLVQTENRPIEEVLQVDMTTHLKKMMPENIHISMVIFTDELFGFIINTPRESFTNHFDQICDVLTAGKSLFQREEKTGVTLSVSACHRGLNSLPLCYDEALKAMLYKKIAGSNKILYYPELENISNLYHYSLEDQQTLIGLIRNGNEREAGLLIDTLFDLNFRKRVITVEVGMCFVFDLLGTFYKLCNTHDDLEIISRLKPVSHVGKCGTMEEIHRVILNLVSALSSHYDQIRSITRIIERVEAIVKKSFQDSQLYVTSIAEQVALSPNYLSKVYKLHRGVSLLSYIHRIRLIEVKKLLNQGNLNLNEVALKTGFSDSNSLIRVFKKYEGISPGKYKKIQNP